MNQKLGLKMFPFKANI